MGRRIQPENKQRTSRDLKIGSGSANGHAFHRGRAWPRSIHDSASQCSQQSASAYRCVARSRCDRVPGAVNHNGSEGETFVSDDQAGRSSGPKDQLAGTAVNIAGDHGTEAFRRKCTVRPNPRDGTQLQRSARRKHEAGHNGRPEGSRGRLSLTSPAAGGKDDSEDGEYEPDQTSCYP